MSQINASELTSTMLEQGYCIVPNLLPRAMVEAFNADLDPVFDATPFGHGRFYGYRTKRFGGLLKRSQLAKYLVLEPTVIRHARSGVSRTNWRRASQGSANFSMRLASQSFWTRRSPVLDGMPEPIPSALVDTAVSWHW